MRPRSRPVILAALVAVVLAGLASRRFPFLLPAFLGKYPGDALWTLMVYCGLAWLRPAARTRDLAALSLAFSGAVEASQLYRPPWLNAIRATSLGHLALGTTFAWGDLLAYAAGALIGWGLDGWLSHRAAGRSVSVR